VVAAVDDRGWPRGETRNFGYRAMKEKRKYLIDSPIKKFLASAMDWFGYGIIRPKQNLHIRKDAIHKILLIRLDHIGDLLMTTPALRALRTTYPKAEIHLLVKEVTSEVLKLNLNLDRIITFNASWTIAKGKRAPRGETICLIGRLRKERYDCVIDFRADPREALLSLFTGAPYRLGYGGRGGGFCFTHPGEYNLEDHEIRRAINLLSPLEVTSDGDNMDFFFSTEDQDEADAIIRKAGIKPGGKLAGIHPGAASPFKRWTEEGFAELGDLLIEDGYQVLLLGAPGDRNLLESITGQMKNSSVVVSDINLKVLGALINYLDFLVCNDSAPSHIAQAVGTGAVVLYGPTHDEVTGPLDREKNQVVRNLVPCAPCWLPGTEFECRYELRCWKKLEAEMVMKNVLSL
ncbi:MAG: glycosyltransferase family 9 protein, partial [Candidatus Auribacterota bacterium]|nr:glycosyltransferase family 9 protein [Candidatus Auribacterota bacterium]